MTFQIRDLLWLTAVVGLHFAARGIAGAIGTASAFSLVPLFVTLVGCVGWSVLRKPSPTLLAGTLLGFVIGMLSSTQLMLEIALDLSHVGYWHWPRDWLLGLGIIGSESVLGGLIGLMVAPIAHCFASPSDEPGDG